MCGTLYRPKERPELSIASFYNVFYSYSFKHAHTREYDDIRTKEASQKRICEFSVPIEHLLRPLFVGIREVQERVSERIEERYVDGTVKASRVAERGRRRSSDRK